MAIFYCCNVWKWFSTHTSKYLHMQKPQFRYWTPQPYFTSNRIESNINTKHICSSIIGRERARCDKVTGWREGTLARCFYLFGENAKEWNEWQNEESESLSQKMNRWMVVLTRAFAHAYSSVAFHTDIFFSSNIYYLMSGWVLAWGFSCAYASHAFHMQIVVAADCDTNTYKIHKRQSSVRDFLFVVVCVMQKKMFTKKLRLCANDLYTYFLARKIRFALTTTTMSIDGMARVALVGCVLSDYLRHASPTIRITPTVGAAAIHTLERLNAHRTCIAICH